MIDEKKLEYFREYMKSGKTVEDEMLQIFHEMSQEAIKITMELNTKYHDEYEIIEIFSKLTGKNVDKTFRIL